MGALSTDFNSIQVFPMSKVNKTEAKRKCRYPQSVVLTTIVGQNTLNWEFDFLFSTKQAP